uniref:Uncharacterized protein n=1 Tax=viral metagenome TaxID=1070528 RepID=A0A6C0I2G5_9ZZZZ
MISLLSEEEQVILDILMKDKADEFLQILHMFHKFTYVENK